MISSASSSSRPTATALAATLLLLGCGGAGAKLSTQPGPVLARVALFPLENQSGASAPMRELLEPVERALAARGLEVVSGEIVQRFLSKYRIRHTGGLDRPSAKAAREELGVAGVVLTA